MKEKLLKLQEKRTKLMQAQDDLLKLVASEKRDFTDDEQTTLDNRKAEIDKLARKIQNVEYQLENERQLRLARARSADPTPEAKAKKRYSLLRAIRSEVENRQLDGIELEMHQEAQKEAREIGKAIRGIGIPTMISSPEKREFTAGSATSAGGTIGTDIAEFQDHLVPRTCLEELGAEMITGLVGNLDVPIGDALATAAWEGEGDSDAESTGTIKSETMEPHRLAATSIFTKQWLFQTSTSVERLLFKGLRTAEQIALETAGMNGAGGGSDVPLGILGHADINNVVMGTNGAVPTHAKLIEMQTALSVDNADSGTQAYILTPEVIGLLKTTKVDAGSGIFIMDPRMPNELLGYKVKGSNLMPKTLTKGSSDSICHAGIFGDFSKMWIGNWGVRDLLVNPYTSARQGKIELTMDSYWDIVIIHGQAFAVVKDFLIS